LSRLPVPLITVSVRGVDTGSILATVAVYAARHLPLDPWVVGTGVQAKAEASAAEGGRRLRRLADI
jgi:hypothetical protein